MITNGEATFMLTGRNLYVFREVSRINIEIANQAASLPIVYRRTTGQIGDSGRRQKLLRFGFYSDGEDRQTISINIIDRWAFTSEMIGLNAQQMQSLLDLLEEAENIGTETSDQISQLNALVSETRRFR